MLKKARLVVLIAFLAMFTPLSMDMYLPALPSMINYFDTDQITMNSTLYIFFFLMAIGMLAFCPLSDKFGRKKILIPSAFAYCFTSLACAFSTTIFALIFFRALQALCVGSLVGLSTALIKDAFEGNQRSTMLGISQAMSLIAPVVAPLIGAYVLTFFSWQANFVILAGLGAVSCVLILTQEETLPETNRLNSSVFGAWLHLGNVIKDRSFTFYLLATSIAPMGFMAYVASSSYIYQNQFSLSEMQFGSFYAICAAVTVLASLTYIKTSTIFKMKPLTQFNMLMILISGILILTVGNRGPIAFLLSFLPLAFFSTSLRPLSISVLLSQRPQDAGAASSLLNFTQTIMCFLGLVLGSFPWANLVKSLGLIIVSSSIFALGIWIIILQSKKIRLFAFDEVDKD